MEKNFQSEAVAEALVSAKGRHIVEELTMEVGPSDDERTAIWAVEFCDAHGRKFIGALSICDWAIVRPMYLAEGGEIKEEKAYDITRSILVKGSGIAVERCQEYNLDPRNKARAITRVLHIPSGNWHAV